MRSCWARCNSSSSFLYNYLILSGVAFGFFMAVSHLWLSFLTGWTNKRGPFTSIISSSCSSQQKFSISAQSLALHFMLLNFILFSWLRFLRSSGSSSLMAWLLFPLRVLLQTSLGPSLSSIPRSIIKIGWEQAQDWPLRNCSNSPGVVWGHLSFQQHFPYLRTAVEIHSL